MPDDDDDVRSPIDLRDAETARTWLADSEAKRPYRPAVRACIAEAVRAHGARSVIELGGGPGLLAETIVGVIAAPYTLVDFSRPMLEMARARVPSVVCELRDLRDPAWASGLGLFDAAVTMQAVHELRHKRRAVTLYEQVHTLLADGGLFVVCDHRPQDERPLYMTEAEQHTALAAMGFREIATVMTVATLYVITARRSERSPRR